MATYTDNLTGTGVLGANWTVTSPGDWERTASGAVQEQASGAYRKAAYTGGAMDSNDYAVEATFAYESDGGIGHGVAARWASGSTVTCYALIRFANEVYFVEITAGAETTVALVSTPGTGNRTLRLEVEGTTIRSYVDGGLVDTRTDASLSSGAPGLLAYGGGTVAGGNTAYALNWSAEDLAAGGSAIDPATGTSTVTTTGRSRAQATATPAAGTSSGSAIGRARRQATMSAATGTSSGATTGRSQAQAGGVAAGTSTVSASVGRSRAQASGTATGTSSAAIGAASTASGSATSAGSSTVSAIGRARVSASATSAGTSSTTVSAESMAQASGTAIGTSSAAMIGAGVTPGASAMNPATGTSAASITARSVVRSAMTPAVGTSSAAMTSAAMAQAAFGVATGTSSSAMNAGGSAIIIEPAAPAYAARASILPYRADDTDRYAPPDVPDYAAAFTPTRWAAMTIYEVMA